jgi:hypothetical protein
MVAPMVESGVSLESGGRFCVGAFGRNLASDAGKMFSHLIYFIRTSYKLYILMQFAKIMLQQIVLLFDPRKAQSRQL